MNNATEYITKTIVTLLDILIIAVCISYAYLNFKNEDSAFIYRGTSITVAPQKMFTDEIMNFLAEFSPQLNQKILQIKIEITKTEKGIVELQLLQKKYPEHSVMVDSTLEKWQSLIKQLNTAYSDILNQVEGAFVAYEIDKLQGRNNFSSLSNELLNDANSVLENVEIIKSTLEKQISE